LKKPIRRFSLPRPAKVSEQMKAWSAALTGEMASWPQVRSRVFFGYTAFYRRDAIFALLPRTRALDPPDSIAFKLESASPRIRDRVKRDRRFGSTEIRKTPWFTFELSSDDDLRDALTWLQRAHGAAT
jgi:hypothetical protein